MSDEHITFAMLDRVMEPMRASLINIEKKLDQVSIISERVATQGEAHNSLNERLVKVEGIQVKDSVELAELRGVNKIISWILGLVGAPLIVVLAGAGLARFLGLVQ
jgi:hypothetical protein